MRWCVAACAYGCAWTSTFVLFLVSRQRYSIRCIRRESECMCFRHCGNTQAQDSMPTTHYWGEGHEAGIFFINTIFFFFFLLIVIWKRTTLTTTLCYTHTYTCSTIRRFLPTPRFACRCSLMSATSPRGPTRLAFLPGIRELPPEAARNVAAMPTSRRAVTP